MFDIYCVIFVAQLHFIFLFYELSLFVIAVLLIFHFLEVYCCML